MDQTLLVFVDEEIQLQRLMERNHYTKQEALARIQSQMPLAEKKRVADVVIDNNGSIEQTEATMKNILSAMGIPKRRSLVLLFLRLQVRKMHN